MFGVGENKGSLYHSLGAGTGGGKGEMDPRAAGWVAVRTGCREWKRSEGRKGSEVWASPQRATPTLAEVGKSGSHSTVTYSPLWGPAAPSAQGRAEWSHFPTPYSFQPQLHPGSGEVS